MITSNQVLVRLKSVMDPELHVDIVSLGLVYEAKINNTQITITMTLTTPGCPLAPVIEQLIHEALAPLGTYEVVLNLVWEPAWTKDMMSDEAKLQLGMV